MLDIWLFILFGGPGLAIGVMCGRLITRLSVLWMVIGVAWAFALAWVLIESERCSDAGNVCGENAGLHVVVTATCNAVALLLAAAVARLIARRGNAEPK